MKLNLKYLLRQDQADYWKKYIGDNGMTFGINDFGKSAPYKDIFKYFGFNIKNKSKKKINKINEN